jgi:hypothetical protein
MTKSIIWFTLALTAVVNVKADNHASPPLQYPLAQVIITLQEKPGPGSTGYQIRINGDGKGTYQPNKAIPQESAQLNLSKEQLVALINDFYQIHFFDLSNNYMVTKQVTLKGNTTLVTIGAKMNDVATKQLCIQLSDYQKCFDIVADRPKEANGLYEKIKALFVNPS